jgi:Carboxypeptidase regulatory-like domain/TonB dependent receptor
MKPIYHAVRFASSLFVSCLCLVALVVNLAMPSRLVAQAGSTGAISGIITDSQGTAVPGADVQATNVATGVASHAKTNDSGVFTIPYLALGNYEVTIKAAGMKESVVKGVLVDQAAIARVDSTLEVGNINQSVTVTSQTPLVERENTTFYAEVTRKFVDDLPSLTGGGTRDATTMANILPGVQTPGAVSGQSYGAQFGVNIGGGRQFSTEFQMDGMNVAYQGTTASVPLDMRPDFDLVSELKVQVGVPNAEYGRSSGGVLTYLSRSGTNDLHGNATLLVRNTVFDARAYNASSVGIDQQWELPLSLGGPVYIPKVYNGRNRTFFFFNYTGFRQRPGGNPADVTLPTAQERTGNFSDVSTPIFSPTTHLPFAGNMIPTSQISSVSGAINAFYPKPTSPGLTANFSGTELAYSTADDEFAKVDHNFSDKNHFSASYRHRDIPSLYAEGAPYGNGLSGDFSPRSVHQDMASDDWIISPTLVNHIAASDVGFYTAQDSNPLNPSDWVPVPNSFGPAFPSFCFTTNGYAGMGMGLGSCAVSAHNYELDRSRDFQDAVSWVKGSHAFKFGARYLWFQNASAEEDSRNGVYQFSQLETAQVTNGSTVPGTGNSYASFLLGAVDSANMSLVQPPDYHTNYFGVYAQDDWKVNKKLTINYGVRWDFQPPLTEMHNMVSEMNPATPNPGAAGFPGAYVFAQQQHVNTFVPTYYRGFAPRLGVAYAVTPSLVVRASAGIILAPQNDDDPAVDSTGYSGSKTVNSPDGGVTPAMYWDQGWTNVIRPPSFDPTIQNGGTANIMASSADHPSTTNIWQLDVQKSFARDYMFNLGYIGQSMHHIPGYLDVVNQDNPSALSLGSLLNDSITNSAVVAAGYLPPYAGFTGTLAQALKPFPQYFGVNFAGNRPGSASYNALLLKAEKRFSNGLQFLVSYTWSKTLTDVAQNAFGIPGPQDTYNLKPEKQLAAYDVPWTTVISFTYALPWGPGRPYLQHGLVSQILGGWALSGILTFTGGTPVAVSAPNDLPIGNDRLDADYLGGPISTNSGNITIANGLTQGTVTLNRAAFGFPAPYTFGNTNVLPNVRTVGFQSENFSLLKRETFRDRYVFELRFDMFNAFNLKDPGGLITDLTNPLFGQYTSSNIPPKQCQLGAKFVF